MPRRDVLELTFTLSIRILWLNGWVSCLYFTKAFGIMFVLSWRMIISRRTKRSLSKCEKNPFNKFLFCNHAPGTRRRRMVVVGNFSAVRELFYFHRSFQGWVRTHNYFGSVALHGIFGRAGFKPVQKDWPALWHRAPPKRWVPKILGLSHPLKGAAQSQNGVSPGVTPS